ncbi:hypothetical protein [Streptomyces sp. MA15]
MAALRERVPGAGHPDVLVSRREAAVAPGRLGDRAHAPTEYRRGPSP